MAQVVPRSLSPDSGRKVSASDHLEGIMRFVVRDREALVWSLDDPEEMSGR
jgi:hypothetical protein